MADVELNTSVLKAYRALHEHPEAGKQENFARDYLLAALRPLSLDYVAIPNLPTAVLAVLDTGRKGPVIALRAELDARPLDGGQVEPFAHDPRSQIDGLMHNCGHDAHAAMLLGATLFASKHRSRLAGKFAFLFQPAEEIAGGADDVVASGALQSLKVDGVFAQHCTPGLPVGAAQLIRGTPLAGSTGLTLTLRGRESHAAAPFEGDDLVPVAARFISELSMLPARQLDIANRPAVISITQMSTNAQTRNGLPSEVRLSGTVRAFEAVAPVTLSGSLGELIQARVDALAAAYNVRAELSLSAGSPPTRNDDALFDLAVPILKKRWAGDLSSPFSRGMFSEDFAFYTECFPALYFNLGIAKDGLGEQSVHSREFTLHPDALAVGTSLLVSLMTEVAPRLRG